MKTPDDGDKRSTGLGRKVDATQQATAAPVWRPVPDHPDYETDGSSIRKKEQPLPPMSIYEFFGMARP